MINKKIFKILILMLILVLISACSILYIIKNNSPITSNNIEMPQFIIWNDSTYVSTGQFVKKLGKLIGKDNEGREIFEDPSNPNSNDIILIFGDLKLKFKPYNFTEEDAILQALQHITILEKVKNLPFPKKNEEEKTIQIQTNNNEKIQMYLKTKIEKKSKILYKVTFSADWIEKDNGEAKQKTHSWIYDVSPGKTQNTSDVGDKIPN